MSCRSAVGGPAVQQNATQKPATFEVLPPPSGSATSGSSPTGDLVDPVWGLLDMSPEGPGGLFPKLSYE